MKKTIVFVLTAAAVSVVFGGSLFSEKESAKTAVINKYKEAENLINKINNDIQNEKNHKEENSKNQIMETLKSKKQEATEMLEKTVKETTRTAIAKGKPYQSIECIAGTSIDGKNIIKNTEENSKNVIENVLNLKLKKLELLQIQTELISQGLAVLKTQNLDKIESLNSGYEAVKADATKKVESAKKQLHEIENRITKPHLNDEYSTVRKQIESKFKDITDNLQKRLQKCIA